MSWHIYAADGRRAQPCQDPAWDATAQLRDWIGFEGQHVFWRPTWFAARMSRGWRLFELDVDEVDFVHRSTMSNWWEPANIRQRRFPNLAALEMWIRHVGVQT